MSEAHNSTEVAPERAPHLRAGWLVPAAIALLALALRMRHIGWGLPSVFEEATPLKKAWDMWGFGPLRAFDLNPHWFQYPSLIFYVQLVGQGVTALLLRLAGAVHSWAELNLLFVTDPTVFYRVGRGITALFGAATVLPTWALARRAAGTGAATVAALLVALHPGLIAKSQVVEVDVPLVFFVTLGLARALAHGPASTSRDWLVSGVITGLAASTKYPGFILALPFALAAWGAPPRPAPRPAAVAAPRRERRAHRRARSEPTGHSPSTLGAWLARMVPFTVGAGVAFVATSPYLFLDRSEAARDLAIGRELMTLGHFGVSAGPAYLTYAHDWFTGLLGAPLGIASLVGLAWAALRRERWALLLAALVVPFVVVVGSWQMKADRYLLPLVPIAAVGAAWLFARLASRLPERVSAARWVVPAAGALACAVPLVAMLPAYWRTLGADTRDQARRWIEDHLPAGSYVASELYGPDLLSPMGLLTVDGDVLAQIATRAPTRPLYAVQVVPMFVMGPERSTKFYALARYRVMDAFIVSSAIRERYRGDPARYAPQLAFYDSLEAGWPKVASFEPHGGPGPRIAVYRNPAATAPFARRAEAPTVDSTIATTSPLTGGEAFWYMNQGLSHELAGHDRSAETCYRLALHFGASEPMEYQRVAIRLAGLFEAEGHHERALATLQSLAARAPGRGIAQALREACEALRAGRSICVRLRPPARS